MRSLGVWVFVTSSGAELSFEVIDGEHLVAVIERLTQRFGSVRTMHPELWS